MKNVVLITGASSGIGYSTAEVFAQKGHDVIIHYLTHEKEAKTLAKYLEETYQSNTLCIKADLRKEQEIEEMINTIIEYYGKLDVVVNNAGIAIDTTFEDKTTENFKKTLEVNLIGTFLVSKYASKIMIQNKKGCIINISSTNSIDSYYPYSMDYDSSKAGINLLTKNLAVEFSPYIRVNAIAPGWVNTPMNQELDNDYVEAETKKIALKRFAEPVEIAKIIYFLSCDEASYINGSIIVADGGRI